MNLKYLEMFVKIVGLKRRREPGFSKDCSRVGDVEAVKDAVKSGMGYSYMSNRAIKEEVAANQLRILRVYGFQPIKRDLLRDYKERQERVTSG